MKDIRLISLLLDISVLLAFSACSRSTEPTSPSEEQQSTQAQENQPTSESETEDSADDSSQKNEEEPTEEELIELLDKAMNEINYLATESTDFIVSQIFNHEMEFYYDEEIFINDFPYIKTSKQYHNLENYYGQFFTGKAIDWIMSKRFADIDGILYCSEYAGASGFSSKATSIEKLERNAYLVHYQLFGIDDTPHEGSTTFSIEKTDAGYRVSDIDHRPDLLDRK